MAIYPSAVAEQDPVAAAALAAHAATDASDAELAAEASTRASADVALDARLDTLEVAGQAVPVFVSTVAPTSPPASYLWVKLDGAGAVDDLIAVGV